MTVQVPIPDYAAARRAMIESQLRPVGVNDAAVLEAMDSVAARAVRAGGQPAALLCRPLVPIGGGRFLAAPAVLGQLLTEMDRRRANARSCRRRTVIRRLSWLIACDVVALENSSELAGPRKRTRHQRRRRAARSRPQAAHPTSDPDRRSGRAYSGADHQAAGQRRAARHCADGARHHSADRRPKSRRSVRLSVDRRCGRRSAAGLRTASGL